MFVYVVRPRRDLLLGQEIVAFEPPVMLVVVGVVTVAAFEPYAVLLAPSVDVVQAPVSHLRLAVAVHVVGREAQGGLRLLAEEVQVAVRRAVMLRVVVRARLESVLGVHLAEYGGFHLVVGDDVDRLVAVAVVDARKFGLIAQFVEHLHRLHRLGGQGLDGRGHVVAEKLAAVDEDLLHRLALRLDAAAVHRDAGHLGQQARRCRRRASPYKPTRCRLWCRR